MFDWFPDFFTNHAFAILALMYNFNFHGVLTNIASCMSDRDQTKVDVSAGTVDGFIWSTWHLGKLDWFLYWIMWKFANFFFLMSWLCNFVRNLTWTSGFVARILLCHCRLLPPHIHRQSLHQTIVMASYSLLVILF